MAERMRPKRTSSDYEVGYKKPPKSGQFKKGQSGNPAGRSRGSKNFKTYVLDMFKSRVTVTKDGKRRKVTVPEAFLMRLVEKALNGDARAMCELRTLLQAYAIEDSPQTEALSSDDEALIAIYNDRLLKGATPAKGVSEPSGDDETKDPDISEDEVSGSDAARKTRKRHIKRVRLNRKDDEVRNGDD